MTFPRPCPPKAPKSRRVSWGTERRWWISTLSCRLHFPEALLRAIQIRSCFVARCFHCLAVIYPLPLFISTSFILHFSPFCLCSFRVSFTCTFSLLCTKPVFQDCSTSHDNIVMVRTSPACLNPPVAPPASETTSFCLLRDVKGGTAQHCWTS